MTDEKRRDAPATDPPASGPPTPAGPSVPRRRHPSTGRQHGTHQEAAGRQHGAAPGTSPATAATGAPAASPGAASDAASGSTSAGGPGEAGEKANVPFSQDPAELLVEMKDTSELMVDLAYGSVFYDSKRLAKVVEDLELEMGEYLLSLQRRVLEMVRSGELPIDNALVALRVAQAAEVIANSALEIADVVLREVELHPVLAESIRDSDSSITRVQLHPGSEFIGPSLRDIELETETGMRVLAVRRGHRWHSKVRGGFHLQAEDTVIAMGPEEASPSFRKRCDPTLNE